MSTNNRSYFQFAYLPIWLIRLKRNVAMHRPAVRWIIVVYFGAVVSLANARHFDANYNTGRGHLNV